ncbi:MULTISPECIES: ABC transporter permease [unclassified Corynebacterium]|uniref:ABC transporter permease n=1 Tax=unclassified Corynebacterium TaxID=2624378 RepID=UPI0029C9F56E|nr:MULTISPECIES: ABC transporter permease [unclassified Corynebacterium]WPF65709.1 ABC transporter permease [Corynebacterium sp. 22KM0430]WPF68205.1 ABC transporter permease [Corynebacterium sp. 21KM1197]
MSYSRVNAIGTVAAQEVRIASRNKAIKFSLATIVVVIVAACGVISWLQNRDSDQPHLVVAGMEAAEFQKLSGAPGIEVSTAEAQSARQQVEDTADAALIVSPQGWELLADGTPDSTLAAATETAAQAWTHQRALDSLGINTTDYAQAAAPVNITHTNIGEEADFGAVFSIVIGLMVVMYFVLLFAANIGGRVTEEKSSRVIELILASTRPLDFLAGKILGNLAIGFINTLIVSTVGVVALNVTGLAESINFDFSLLPLFLVVFVLGMLFFGTLWAAAGSMVSRSEDLASTQAPIMLLIVATIYAASFGMSATGSTVMHVLAWIPPFSLTVAPTQYAAGEMSALHLELSYGIFALAVLAALALTARIYRRSILRNGQKVTWRAALSRA